MVVDWSVYGLLSRQVAGCSRLFKLVGTDEMLVNAPPLSHSLPSSWVTAIMHFACPLCLPLSLNSCGFHVHNNSFARLCQSQINQMTRKLLFSHSLLWLLTQQWNKTLWTVQLLWAVSCLWQSQLHFYFIDDSHYCQYVIYSRLWHVTGAMHSACDSMVQNKTENSASTLDPLLHSQTQGWRTQ